MSLFTMQAHSTLILQLPGGVPLPPRHILLHNIRSNKKYCVQTPVCHTSALQMAFAALWEESINELAEIMLTYVHYPFSGTVLPMLVQGTCVVLKCKHFPGNLKVFFLWIQMLGQALSDQHCNTLSSVLVGNLLGYVNLPKKSAIFVVLIHLNA